MKKIIEINEEYACNGVPACDRYSVVTQIGVHITPAPKAYIKCEISVPKEEDLVPLTGILSDLLRRRIIANSPGFANIVAQVLANSRDPDIAAKITPYLGKCSIPTEILDDIRAHKDWAYWTALISLYGTLEVVQAQLQSVKRAFEKVPGVKVSSQLFSGPPGESLKATVISEAPEVLPQTGRPTLASLAFLNVKEPGGGHVAFAPIIPPSGRELYEWYLEAKQTTTEAGFNFLADFHLFARYVIAINLVMFTGSEQKEMNTLLRRLTDQTTKRGFSEYRTHVSVKTMCPEKANDVHFSEYRTHVSFVDNVASHHSFNNSAQRKLMMSLKDMLDPKGILSPGKSGIWNSEG
ncbi:hypothetical protein V498_00229 [Pseudogymnoascus sp. VKM F-4517 (FW-2822)]|nr:hypothetical protein V498_00229 [Pseudogymnoascus sp. VKM F-4517 (FW-2822)]